jgi:hypothetical protein
MLDIARRFLCGVGSMDVAPGSSGLKVDHGCPGGDEVILGCFYH